MHSKCCDGVLETKLAEPCRVHWIDAKAKFLCRCWRLLSLARVPHTPCASFSGLRKTSLADRKKIAKWLFRTKWFLLRLRMHIVESDWVVTRWDLGKASYQEKDVSFESDQLLDAGAYEKNAELAVGLLVGIKSLLGWRWTCSECIMLGWRCLRLLNLSSATKGQSLRGLWIEHFWTFGMLFKTKLSDLFQISTSTGSAARLLDLEFIIFFSGKSSTPFSNG